MCIAQLIINECKNKLEYDGLFLLCDMHMHIAQCTIHTCVSLCLSPKFCSMLEAGFRLKLDVYAYNFNYLIT